MTGDALRPDRHDADAHGRDGDDQQRPGHQHPGRGRPVQRPARRRPSVGAEHERPARQAPAHHGQGRATSRAAEANDRRRRLHGPAGNLFPAGTARTRPEIYAMGFRNPFRITLDKDDVAYVSDYSPDSQVPQQFRGPAGTGRFEIVREPANYGWPLCYKTDLPYYQWDFNTSTPLPSAAAPEPHDCDDPSARAAEHVALGRERRPDGRAGARVRPADHATRRSGTRTATTRRPERPAGHAVLRELRTAAPRANPVGACPQLFPELVHRRRRAARHRAVRLRPGQPEPDQVPALLGRGLDRRRVHAGHDARGPHGLERRDPQDQQHAAVRPGAGDADPSVAVRQPDGHGVRAGRHVLPADLRRRLLRHQPGRRDDALGVRQGAARAGRGRLGRRRRTARRR